MRRQKGNTPLGLRALLLITPADLALHRFGSANELRESRHGVFKVALMVDKPNERHARKLPKPLRRKARRAESRPALRLGRPEPDYRHQSH